MAETEMLDTRTDMLDIKAGMLHKKIETMCEWNFIDLWPMRT